MRRSSTSARCRVSCTCARGHRMAWPRPRSRSSPAIWPANGPPMVSASTRSRRGTSARSARNRRSPIRIIWTKCSRARRWDESASPRKWPLQSRFCACRLRLTSPANALRSMAVFCVMDFELAAGKRAYRFRLPYRAPYDFTALLAFFSRRAISGVEQVEVDSYSRRFAIDGVIGTLHVSQIADDDALALVVDFPRTASLPDICARVRRMFDLDADMTAINAQLGRKAPL